MSTLIPLPTPRSVMSSPSHMITPVPAVMQITMVREREDVRLVENRFVAALEQLTGSGQGDEAGRLQDGQPDREVSAVLGQLLLAGLTFLLQLLEPRDDHDEKLDDDARRDVGQDAQSEHGQPEQRAAGEQVDQGINIL